MTLNPAQYRVHASCHNKELIRRGGLFSLSCEFLAVQEKAVLYPGIRPGGIACIGETMNSKK